MFKFIAKCTVCSFLLTLFVTVRPQVILAKIELNSSIPPTELQADQSFTLTVSLKDVDESAEYYIRGVFYKPETSQYFGLTQNNQSEWNANTAEFTKFFKVTGTTPAEISFKPDPSSPSYTEGGQYLFKIGRYTTGGSLTWSEQTPSVVILKPKEISPTPTPPVTTTLTPTLSPPLPTTVHIDPSTIGLSEIMACPESGQEEWVEIVNKTASVVSLTNWKIKDSIDSHSVAVSGTLSSYGFLIVRISSSMLNNSGDSVRLYTDTDILSDQMSFTDCKVGTSYIKIDDQWQTTTDITQGSSNQFVPLATPTVTPISSLPVENQETGIGGENFTGTEDHAISNLSDPPLDADLENTLSPQLDDILAPHTEITSESSQEARNPSQESQTSQSVFSAKSAFLLGGCSYILTAAMLAQKWYNLTSG